MRTLYFFLSLLISVLIACPITAYSNPRYKSKYEGQDRREIKSLSDQDIAELKAGSGWGLAKAAELNGVPGPKHLLEMKNEIKLTPEQVLKIEEIYALMNKQAVTLGLELIELERELNSHFANRTVDEEILKDLLEKIARTYKELRYVHLSAHLKTPLILSPDQIKQYNTLRGYSTDDPCVNIPAGHDPAMWKRHHNCP